MRHLRNGIRLAWPTLTLGLAVVLMGGTSVFGQTVSDFEGGGTPIALEGFGGGPAPVEVFTGGNPDGALQLTQQMNDSHNWATFDTTDIASGTDGFATSAFSFDFKITAEATPSADGFSFSYADTALHGFAGGVTAAPFTAEDPAAAGILGFGFDTWSNAGAWDEPIATGSDYNEISVFWNRNLVERVWDTRTVLTPALTLDDGEWHSVEGTVDFLGETVSMSVDGNPIFTDLAVPGLVPFESRIMLAGRTGGENEEVLLDNVNVTWDTPADAPPIGDQPAPTQGHWSVREWRPDYQVSGIAGVDMVISDPDIQTRRYVRDGMFETINFADPQGAGGGYSMAPGKVPFQSDTPLDDNDFVIRGNATIIIPEDGEYTFGIDGDDATRLQISGANFTYQGGTMGGMASGEVLEFPTDTGNAFSLASTFLEAGEYDVEVTWNERGGGAFVEVFAAPGVFNANEGETPDDGTLTQQELLDRGFSLIGQQEKVVAQGTLPTTTGDWNIKTVGVVPDFVSSTGGAGLNTIADAEAALQLTVLDLDWASDGEDTRPVFNMADPDTNAMGGGRFTPDDVYPVNFPGDDNDIATEGTVTVSIAEEGDYIFGFASDDGAALTLEGADFTILNPGSPRAVTNDGQTIEFNANTGNSDTFATTHLMPGEYELRFVTWERGGGAFAEVYTGVGAFPESILSARLLGSPAETFDIVVPAGLQLAGEPVVVDGIPGDFNDSGLVEQGDLDLVLGNWGANAGDVPASWSNDPPEGIVDQAELDKVLGNWGRNMPGLGTAAGVPEPSSIALLLVVAGLGLGARLARKR